MTFQENDVAPCSSNLQESQVTDNTKFLFQTDSLYIMRGYVRNTREYSSALITTNLNPKSSTYVRETK